MIPSYFLYFTVDPSIIDVNIHPTKTEIKFQDESAIFQIILASVKEALGKFNVTPTIDFDTEDKVDFTVPDSPILPKVPKVSYNPHYNPFNYSTSISKEDSNFEQSGGNSSRQNFEPRHKEKFPRTGMHSSPDWKIKPKKYKLKSPKWQRNRRTTKESSLSCK